MTNGGWQLIYNRNNAYFTPDHMVQRYPNDKINFNVNSTSWYIPPDAGLWKWEISVDGGTTWRGITTGIPGTAFKYTHNTAINVPVSNVNDNSLSSSGSFYYQTFSLDDQCLFGCDSGSATWWGIVNVSQGAGDQFNPGIGGHSDVCDLDNNLVVGDNYTWGDDDLEIYLSDYKNIPGDGIGGTNCIPDGPTDLYRYRFWALSEKGAKRGEKGAKANADILSKEERRVHHFIVMKMAVVKDPITAELIAHELGMPNDRVLEIIDKLGLSLRKKYEYPKQALVINAFWRFNNSGSFFRDR